MKSEPQPDRKGIECYAGWGFGAAFGAAAAFFIYVLGFVLVGGPLQEVLERHFLDPKRRRGKPAPAPRVMDGSAPPMHGEGPFRIIVSDLHIDTWESKPERQDAFMAFLRAIHAHPHVKEIFINGDLMDIPLHPLHEGDGEPMTYDPKSGVYEGVLSDEVLPMLQLIVELARTPRPNNTAPLQTFYLTGNHDIGISGLRFMRPDLHELPVQILWNPAGLIRWQSDGRGEPAIYIEHGHLHDPMIWLYLRYAVLDYLRADERSQWKVQRNANTGMGSAKYAKGTEGSAPPPHEKRRQSPLLRIGDILIRYRYRHAARRAQRRLTGRDPELRVQNVIFGHTHLPDACWMPGKHGTEWEYINAGSWAGATEDQMYWIVNEEGEIGGPYQWRESDGLQIRA